MRRVFTNGPGDRGSIAGRVILLYIELRPRQTCHSKDAEVHIPLRAWLTVWDRVKIPRYTHRLMHRKRVTCELHDSYFPLMTIKHAIPRTAEVTHPDGQPWGDIVWAIELLYNSLRTGNQLVWRPDPLVTRCGRESQHQAEWTLRPPVEQPKRTGEKHGYGQ